MRWTQSLLVPLVVAAGIAGCSGDDANGPSAECRSLCTQTCQAVEDCKLDVVPPSCADDCAQTMTGRDCRGARPPGQLTCDELKDVYACSKHCAALCQRAPECGPFDPQLCLIGCTDGGPPICNAASVPVRSCDDIKQEARQYEDAGRAVRNGDVHSSGFVSGGLVFGLCDNPDACDAPLGCSVATNTCAACANDDECHQAYKDAHACLDGACTKVDCLKDDDCLGGVCDAASHACIGCREDADCSSTYASACEPTTHECVQCVSDADCAGQFYSRCAPGNRCSECLSDADCTGTAGTHCDLASYLCLFSVSTQ